MICYILSHPIQYFSPLLKDLAKNTAIVVVYFSDISIDVGFGKKVIWDTPLLEGYNFTFIKNYSKNNKRDNKFFDLFNPGIVSYLRKSPAKIVVVNGWAYSSNWIAIITCKILGKKVWLRAESPLNQEMKKRPFTLFVKKVLLRYFLFKFFIDRFLYIGHQNKLFYSYHGVSDNDLIFSPYAVDNDMFQLERLRYNEQVDVFRDEMGIKEMSSVVLYCGKYISKKRPKDLIQAFERLGHLNVSLVMVGEGPLRQELELYVLKNGIENVHFTGFINQSSLYKFYMIADLFVMCSGMGETWGLSVNEAMNFSLPVVVSKTCGCSDDLVLHGENGYLFQEGNVDELSFYIDKILTDKELAIKMGKKSLEMIKSFSIQKITKNIIEQV